MTIVINNAGVVSGKPLVDCSDASIQRTFDVNIIAHFWVMIFIKKSHQYILSFRF